jgi:hypothetical protein
MATNTLIQYLERTAYDALPSGSTTAIGPQVMNRRQIETFIAGGAIAANQLVAIDLSQTGLGVQAGTVVPADSDAGATIVAIGFALGSAAEGETVDVTIAGVHETAAIKAAQSIAVGDRLKVSDSAGDADEYANTDTVPVIGYAMTAASGSPLTCSVFVIKQF